MIEYFPPKTRNKAKIFTLPLIFNTVLKVLGNAIMQEKELNCL